MAVKITAEISAEQFEENFNFKEASGLYSDPLFRLVVNKFGRCYWLLAHDNLQGPRFSGNNVYYQGNNSRLIRTIYPNAKRIIDVGANVGNNTIAYGEWAENVESFEPTPTTLKMLLANINIAKHQDLKGVYWKGTDQEGDMWRDEYAKAGWYIHKGVHQSMNITANITVHEVAATNRNEGTIDILDHTDHGGHNHVVLDSDNVKLRDSQNLVPVPARTIDSYNFEDVDCIKIDVEGSELLVMQGAKDTIDRCRPSVQVEIVPKQCTLFGYEPQDLYDFFAERDYVCVSAVRRPMNKEQRDLYWGKNIGMKHRQIKKYMDRLFVPREVHEATDYGTMAQANIDPSAASLFDFG
jgi:FkbM family methyltransferase|tara:strand:- start:1707 stop:2765 length:1059 start_codon:yes stop_codon:yes gene_type:complete